MKKVSAVQEILRRWDPIGVAPGSFGPADEYDEYAPHIVTLVAQGCSAGDLCRHLEILRTEVIGVEEHQSWDAKIAEEIFEALGKDSQKD